MTQAELHRQIARTTGDSLATVRRHGFQLVAPPAGEPDGEPLDAADGPRFVDWDELDACRPTIFPVRYERLPVAA